MKVEVQLTKDKLLKYKSLLIVYQNVFTWSYKVLKNILSKVAQHHIPQLPRSIPIRQKERRMNLKLYLIVKIELEKLLLGGFIQPMEITNSVSRMV